MASELETQRVSQTRVAGGALPCKRWRTVSPLTQEEDHAAVFGNHGNNKFVFFTYVWNAGSWPYFFRAAFCNIGTPETYLSRPKMKAGEATDAILLAHPSRAPPHERDMEVQSKISPK